MKNIFVVNYVSFRIGIFIIIEFMWEYKVWILILVLEIISCVGYLVRCKIFCVKI